MNKYTFVLLFICCVKSFAQPAPQGYIPNVNPVPPSVFQFIKYDEMPVTEYTGVPDITIPIHNVKEGDFSFPVNLAYHAGGVRVAEEASWVGLNWNLDVGSVTQMVNGRDDLDHTQYTTMYPDYFLYQAEGQSEYYFPPKISLDLLGTDGTPPSISTGISQVNPQHSFVVYSDWYVPVAGQYNQQINLFGGAGMQAASETIDHEPDVFKATFNSHSIQFVISPSNYANPIGTGVIVVLNKSNYVVSKITTAGQACWKITAPDGVQYYFEQVDQISTVNGKSTIGNATSNDNTVYVTNRVWHLTRVVTTTNRTVKFTWSTTAPVNDFPAYSQQARYQNISNPNPSFSFFEQMPFVPLVDQAAIDMITSTNTNAAATHSYLDSIKFSNGYLLFKKSYGRTDVINDARLDSIIVNNSWNKVKKFVFGYSYFYGQSLGPNSVANGSKQLSEVSLRLQLLNFGEVGIPAYQFNYDPTPLPYKTSFATDYWGFYNGKNSNASFIPNPIQTNKPSLPSNGNDHNAYLPSMRAATLNEIIYPTGGKTDFTYGTNRFRASVFDTITYGNGLRVQAVTMSTPENGVIKQINYSYAGGQIVNQIAPHINFSFNSMSVQGPGGGALPPNSDERAVIVDQFSGGGFYTSSLLGSGNYVGYGKVTKQTVDTHGNASGSVVSTYSNQQDVGAFDAISGVILPSIKSIYSPDNGLLLMEKTYDTNQNLLATKINSYAFQLSPVFYGTKIGFCTYSFYAASSGDADNQYLSVEQDIVGYYPIYSGQSLLQWSRMSTLNGSDSVTVLTNYQYNSYNLVSQKSNLNSRGEFVTASYSYPPDLSSTPFMTNLVSLNVIDHPVQVLEQNNGSQTHIKQELYGPFNGLYLLSGVSEVYGNYSPQETRLVIDSRDNYGNITQFHKPSDVVHSFIWGYNNSLPIAEVKNAPIGQVAYTGFETPTDLGSWTYSPGASPPVGKTGNYGFNGTTVSKSSLPSGNYVVSFWAMSSSSNGSVSGSVTASVASSTWQFFSFQISSTTSVTLNLSNVTIDDLCLYPVGAQMTFYTHKPLVGITSQTDANNQTTYYLYDSHQRLQTITDYQGNILKNYTYNYENPVLQNQN